MPFFKKNRAGGGKPAGSKGGGKKTTDKYGPQHSLLGNNGTNGKIPITKKAKNILD